MLFDKLILKLIETLNKAWIFGLYNFLIFFYILIF